MHKTYHRAERRLTHSLTRGVSVRLRALSSRKQLPRSDEDPLVEFVKCVGSHQDPGGSDLRAPAPAPRSSREGQRADTQGGRAHWPLCGSCVWSGSRRTADLRLTCWVGAGRRDSPALDDSSFDILPMACPHAEPTQKATIKEASRCDPERPAFCGQRGVLALLLLLFSR